MIDLILVMITDIMAENVTDKSFESTCVTIMYSVYCVVLYNFLYVNKFSDIFFIFILLVNND